MAKNLEITIEMLEDRNACGGTLENFRETFGEKVIINKNNIQKAAEKFEGGDEWVGRLLKDMNNKYVYQKFYKESDKIWRDVCDKDETKCKEREVEHRLRCYTRFVELYRKENKAPKKKKAKVSGEGRNTLEQTP